MVFCQKKSATRGLVADFEKGDVTSSHYQARWFTSDDQKPQERRKEQTCSPDNNNDNVANRTHFSQYPNRFLNNICTISFTEKILLVNSFFLPSPFFFDFDGSSL
jgi:hypothetical protein